jgi:hypothetical protein
LLGTLAEGAVQVKASAFVIGARDGAVAALIHLAREAGLDPVRPYDGLHKAEAQAAQTPLVFFLCAAVADVRSLKPLADAIRFSPSRHLRYLPLVYFAHSPSIEAIKACINMGFDDVIALPFSGERLRSRLARQVGTVQTYFETSTYFGPDRRDRVGSTGPHPRRGTGGDYRRFELIRRETGVEIMHDDQVML